MDFGKFLGEFRRFWWDLWICGDFEEVLDDIEEILEDFTEISGFGGI